MKFNGKGLSCVGTFTLKTAEYEDGYEDGYEEGHTAGYQEGHTEGRSEGYQAGRAEGEEVGYTNGYNTGYVNGHADGYEEGKAECGDDDGSYDEGYEQGKTDAIENLPDGYLKIDPKWTNFSYLCQGRPEMAVNLKHSDTANGTTFLSFCQAITSVLGTFSVPSLDLRKATTIQSMFLYSNGIVEIGMMEIPNVTDARTAFNGCSALQRISFAPGCIKVSIGFPSSNLLDDASIQSVVDGLADLTGATAQTLTFHATVGAKLTDAQKATITAKNWTLVY